MTMRIRTASMLVVCSAVALVDWTRADAGERVFGAEPRYAFYTSTTSPSRATLRTAETLSRNFGAVQSQPAFRNQNGDFSYLTLYSSYGGYSAPYLWGGYYGYGSYSPWWYGYRYAYPYSYYPYAFGYPYGFASYGPTAYYGWPSYGGWYGYGFPYSHGYGFPYTAAYYGPWYAGYGGGWRAPLPNYRYAGCYHW